jgi:hypothetical protein
MRKEILPRWHFVPSCGNFSTEYEDCALEFTFVDQLHKNCVNNTSQKKPHESAESVPWLPSESVDIEIVNIIIKCYWLIK